MAKDELKDAVAILRPRDGTERCLETDVICLHHGAESLARVADVTITLANAIDFAEGDGMSCDLCKAVIVPAGVPVTDDVLAAI